MDIYKQLIICPKPGSWLFLKLFFDKNKPAGPLKSKLISIFCGSGLRVSNWVDRFNSDSKSAQTIVDFKIGTQSKPGWRSKKMER